MSLALRLAPIALVVWGCAEGSASPSSAPAITTAIDRVVAGHYAGGWGVELAIYHAGRPLYVHGYGLRDRGLPDTFGGDETFWNVEQPDVLLNLPRSPVPPDSNTIFDLASVSKQFTAAAILLLEQDGKLSVDDSVSRYLPSFKPGNRLTLVDLLQHRSGLVDYNHFGEAPDFLPAYRAFLASGQINYDVVLDRLGASPLRFTPGSQYEYCNSNYLVLGAIVARVSGMPLDAFLASRIFGPLGMTHTHQGLPAPPSPDFALGYADYMAGPRRAWQPNLRWLAGPGGLTSTVNDLERWDRAVREPGLFTSATLISMFKPGRFALSYGTYADGWFVATLSGHLYHWHDGKLDGYQTMNASFPNDSLDIIVLTNDGSGLDPYYIVPELFPMALNLAARQ